MIAHKSFSARHMVNFIGKASIRNLDEMRREVELFIENSVGEESVINITETSDAYASTVTVWYRIPKQGK